MNKTGHNINCLQCGIIKYIAGWEFKKGRGKYCSKKCYQVAEKGRTNSNLEGLKLGHGWNKGIKFPQFSGENHWNWQGGKTTEIKKLRNSLEYGLWRIAVFTRDNFICIKCGSKKQLEADHIKPFALYPELRFAIDNGRTLCHSCHKQTDTYGWKTRWVQ